MGALYAYLDTLTCIKPEDVGGDETKMEIHIEDEAWERTAGIGLDAVNKQLEDLFTVSAGSAGTADVSPQLPNKGAVLVWKPSKSQLPIKAGEDMRIRWVIPFVTELRVKLIDRDGGFLDPDDNLGTKAIKSSDANSGVLEWRGGSSITASKYHYKLKYKTAPIPEVGDPSDPDVRDLIDDLLGTG